jgi:hypothetical protein
MHGIKKVFSFTYDILYLYIMFILYEKLKLRCSTQNALDTVAGVKECSTVPRLYKRTHNLIYNKSVDFGHITWCYIPEDRTLHNHHYENLKSKNKQPALTVIINGLLRCVVDILSSVHIAHKAYY